MKQIKCKRCNIYWHTMYELPAIGSTNRFALCPFCYQALNIIDYKVRK